jgi:hypothetical protein
MKSKILIIISQILSLIKLLILIFLTIKSHKNQIKITSFLKGKNKKVYWIPIFSAIFTDQKNSLKKHIGH